MLIVCELNTNTFHLFNIKLTLKKTYILLVMLMMSRTDYGQSTANYAPTQIVNWKNWKEDFTISMLFATDETMSEEKSARLKNSLEDLFDELHRERIKYPSDQKFLARVFSKLFDTYLYKYKALTNFTQTIEQKEFDCLTGTLLFALTLEKFGFQYAIHETNYHVYLTVKTSEGEVLIEATDRKFGFEKNKNFIAKRIRGYHYQYEQIKENTKQAYTSLFKIERQISLTELIGLQYFNNAVNAYNKKDSEKAIDLLKKSLQLYDAGRGTELMILSINQYLQNPDLQAHKKDKLLQYQDFYIHKLAAKLED